MGILTAGTLIAQFSLAASALLLTRLYSPASIGEYSRLLAIVLIGGAFASLRWEFNLSRARNSERRHLVGLAMTSALLVALVLAVGSSKLATSAIPTHVWITSVFLGTVLLSWAQTFTYLAIATGSLKRVALGRGLQGLVQAILQPALYGFSVGGLIVGHLIAPAAAISVLVGRKPPYPLGFSRRKTLDMRLERLTAAVRQVLITARKFGRRATWNGTATLFNSAGAQLPVLFLALQSIELSGHYALAIRVLLAPALAFGIASAQFLMSRIALETSNPTESIRAKTAGQARFLAAIIFFLIGAGLTPLIFFGDVAFALVFGSEWTQSGTIVVILVPMVVVTAAASTFSLVPTALTFQKGEAFFQVLLFSVRLAGLVLGTVLHGATGAIFGYTITSVLGWSLYIRWSDRLFEVPHTRTQQRLFLSCLGFLFLFFTMSGASSLLDLPLAANVTMTSVLVLACGFAGFRTLRMWLIYDTDD